MASAADHPSEPGSTDGAVVPEPRPSDGFDFARLRRRPDLEAPNLLAVDAADRLILDEAAPALAEVLSGDLVVIGDHYGALTLAAASLFDLSKIRVHQDALTGEQALAQNAVELDLAGRFTSHALEPALVSGARVVLLQLPRSLDALDEIAALIAEHAHPDVVVFAGGRLKYMSLGMNEILADHFGAVYAGLSRQKSRVLTASEPHAAAAPREFPQSEHHDDFDLTVVAHGGAFAGTKVDIGTRMLLGLVAEAVPGASTIVDLGCGTGVIAAVLARSRPEARVIASDRSAAAVASATATMQANGLAERVEVVRDNALSTVPDASVDLVLLNPPFHADAAVAPEVAIALFEAAARVLRPGGELWCVFNSHLHHRAVLERVVGPTTQVARSPKFIVTSSVRA
ncbi:class I SAM-dependent methyltransferase [Frondihabitans cladoniiphilus]|uniref:Methyltransferase n=1 Tax=Frondihabitans cladoniiphilus TaxID=715785 RepID=A0ABP8W3C9_9MICO